MQSTAIQFTWPTGDEMVAWFQELRVVPDIGVYSQCADDGVCRMCAVGITAMHLADQLGRNVSAECYFDQGDLSDLIADDRDAWEIGVTRRVAAFEQGAWAAHWTRGGKPQNGVSRWDVDEPNRADYDAGLAAWWAVEDAQTAGELPS